MRAGRALALVAMALGLMLTQSGCTMFLCSGGGTLSRAELGDWAGLGEKPAPSPTQLEGLVSDLKMVKSATFLGRFSLHGDSGAFALNCGQCYEVPFTPVSGVIIKGRMSPWARFVPSFQTGHWLYFHPTKKDTRTFYAAESEWGLLICGGERVDAYDVATRERVAARATEEFIGLGLGWTRTRQVRPVDRLGDAGLGPLVSTRTDLAKVRYQLRDANILLLGALGWGRVNHRRYIQVLWIPIPVATVE